MFDYNFNDILKKCRFCIKKFDETGIEVSNWHLHEFYQLTHLEVEADPKFSKFLCSYCDDFLKTLSTFRSKLIERQLKLNREFMNENELMKKCIKTENEDSSLNFIHLIDTPSEESEFLAISKIESLSEANEIAAVSSTVLRPKRMTRVIFQFNLLNCI